MNRMLVCNFLLVRHSNLGPIVPRFRLQRYCKFFAQKMTPPVSYANFGSVSVDSDRWCWDCPRSQNI